MTTYAVQGPPHAGSALSMSAPGGTAGDLCPTGAGIGLLVDNASAGTVTVTLPIGPTYDGLAITPRAVEVPPSSLELIPVPDSVYGPGTTQVKYSAVASVTVAAIKIP